MLKNCLQIFHQQIFLATPWIPFFYQLNYTVMSHNQGMDFLLLFPPLLSFHFFVELVAKEKKRRRKVGGNPVILRILVFGKISVGVFQQQQFCYRWRFLVRVVSLQLALFSKNSFTSVGAYQQKQFYFSWRSFVKVVLLQLVLFRISIFTFVGAFQ